MTVLRNFFQLFVPLALLFSAQSALAQLDLGIPSRYSVTLKAGSGQHAGTKSRIGVRLYSENLKRWSNKKYVRGIEAGSARYLNFLLSPSFTKISQLEVSENNADGLRVNVSLLNRNSGDVSLFTHKARWIKDGRAVLKLIEVVLADSYHCCDNNNDCSGPVDLLTQSGPGRTLVWCREEDNQSICD